jgi:hypothetical protein
MDHRQFQPTLPQTWLHWRTALAGNHEPALARGDAIGAAKYIDIKPCVDNNPFPNKNLLKII